MKHIEVHCVMALATLLSVPSLVAHQTPAQAPPGCGAAPWRPASPEIHADRTVTCRLAAPKATEVTLNGSWEGAKDIKMTKDESGVWSATVGPMGAQLWGYWFLVDG